MSLRSDHNAASVVESFETPKQRGQTKGQEYIGAIHASLDRNYEPMEIVFAAVLKRSMRGSDAVS